MAKEKKKDEGKEGVVKDKCEQTRERATSIHRVVVTAAVATITKVTTTTNSRPFILLVARDVPQLNVYSGRIPILFVITWQVAIKLQNACGHLRQKKIKENQCVKENQQQAEEEERKMNSNRRNRRIKIKKTDKEEANSNSQLANTSCLLFWNQSSQGQLGN